MLNKLNRIYRYSSWIFLSLVILLFFVLNGCSQEKLKVSTEFVEFNTNIKFTAYQISPDNKAEVESLLYQVGELLA